MTILPSPIAAVIGLGNPGKQYYKTRHSIGFHILDVLANRHDASWCEKENMELAEIMIDEKRILLIKPQTFMNASGKVIPFILKQGIKPEQILVIHDELELPFGKLKLRFGGGARGHNGLRSIIDVCGKDFARLSFGIDRPEQREMVAQYVLQNFSEDPVELEQNIEKAVDMIEATLKHKKEYASKR